MFSKTGYFAILLFLLNSFQAFSVEQGDLFVKKCKDTIHSLSNTEEAEQISNEDLLLILTQPIEHFNLSTPIYNIFLSHGIESVGDILSKTEGDLLKLPGFGKKGLQKVRTALINFSKINSHLRMLKYWWPLNRKQVQVLVEKIHPPKRTLPIFLLSPREKQVLRLRFGIEQEKAYTLEETGQFFDLTKERIRQIQVRALQKLWGRYL